MGWGSGWTHWKGYFSRFFGAFVNMASNAIVIGESSQENSNHKRAKYVSAVWQYFERQETEGQ